MGNDRLISYYILINKVFNLFDFFCLKYFWYNCKIMFCIYFKKILIFYFNYRIFNRIFF